ncbi:hypothetical protein L208DRAFT_1249373 [Tricholoma matsutake]|nr:hypothetical protein L208DRAFT_1249373 [Tricholoma matsutake 945]
MLLLISQEIFLCAILCSCWPILRRLVFKTSLDNVLGLPSHSFWMGNILEVFNINGWEFHKELQQKYGGVVRIDAFLGVWDYSLYDLRRTVESFL